MSVLIKGMEMPERCMGCTLCYVGHMDDLKKTGKHYDIQSILEAMRTND